MQEPGDIMAANGVDWAALKKGGLRMVAVLGGFAVLTAILYYTLNFMLSVE